MSTGSAFQKQSYQRHADFYPLKHNSNGEEANLESIFNDVSVDRWRHERMYRLIDPLIEANGKATWLTVGDGRFGKDAWYLLGKGADVHASDISDELLKISHEAGYLPSYSKENAEALSFEDDHFDYTLCKESYHHFPRPMIAVYEMLRVSRKGVLLIEPNDMYVEQGFRAGVFWRFKNMMKSMLGKPLNKKHEFEEVGNYLFRLSQREIEKVAMGLNCRFVAVKYINDAYIPGVGLEPLSEKGTLFRKLTRMIALANLLCKLGLMKHNIIGIAIFKEAPADELKDKLIAHGFDLIILPANPYT